MMLNLIIALRYTLSGKQQRFARFVALLSVLGITIGIAALIVVSSIMQGLQERLKHSVLTDTAHVLVFCSQQELDKFLQLEHVCAAAPFIEAAALLQLNGGMELINLQGIDENGLKFKPNIDISRLDLQLNKIPEANSYTLALDASLYLKYNLSRGDKVRLISTKNARYTPLGLTPTQRLVTLGNYLSAVNTSSNTNALGNFEDVKRIFRAQPQDLQIRLWLDDPFFSEQVAAQINKLGYDSIIWQSKQGDFFKAVALEKLSMSLMLFLIIIVATFNILSALAMMVSSRLSEIAILKSLGMNDKRIMQIFMLMGLGCGLLGSVLGLILGIILTDNAQALTALLGINLLGGSSIPTQILWQNVALIIISSLVLSLICTLYPARKAALAHPVEHLSRN